MEKQILFSLPGNSALASALGKVLHIDIGKTEIRHFPDGESYVRIDTEVNGMVAILVCSLHQPNPQILPLMFMAQTLKELGAKKILLVSPYLPYMRQDKRFRKGEAISAILFAEFLSQWIDGLVTLDPHLHRILKLSDIYSVPSITLHATKKIAQWIQHHIPFSFLIGPDEESKQWVSEIAAFNKLPFVVGQKERLGDRSVVISLPDLKKMQGIPIIIDDVISTGVSMLAILKEVLSYGFSHPICIGVHALFNKEVEHKLLAAGAGDILTCNTISHPSNKIDITDVLAEGIMTLCH